MIRAVLFDMDGILADTEPYWQEAQCKVFGELGIPLSVEDCLETTGKRIQEVVDFRLGKHPEMNLNNETVVEAILRNVISSIQEKAEPMPGVTEVLDYFEDLKIPMALVSSSHYGVINTLLNKLSFRHYFDLIVSAEEMIYGKPHPMPYLKASDILNVIPKECLVFEDSPNGVLSALSAGMHVIAVPGKLIKKNPIFELPFLTLEGFREWNEENIRNLFA